MGRRVKVRSSHESAAAKEQQLPLHEYMLQQRLSAQLSSALLHAVLTSASTRHCTIYTRRPSHSFLQSLLPCSPTVLYSPPPSMQCGSPCPQRL